MLFTLGLFAQCVLLSSCGDDDQCPCAPPTSTERCTYVLDYDEPPRLVIPPQPAYPEEARRRGDEGVVHVRVGVGTDSFPCGAQITSSDAATLDVASLEATLKSKWVPARRRGHAVAVEVDLPIRYSLHLFRVGCGDPGSGAVREPGQRGVAAANGGPPLRGNGTLGDWRRRPLNTALGTWLMQETGNSGARPI
jgi:TonB family protein